MKEGKQEAYLKKLKTDLLKGKEIAYTAAAKVNDKGGSSNMDCIKLYLQYYKQKTIISLCREIGLHCFKNKQCYHIGPCEPWQGAKNTAFAEALCKYLTKKGHTVYMYYKVD